jgi:iron-sulfur cluster repair protein YtfE (RIC family)
MVGRGSFGEVIPSFDKTNPSTWSPNEQTQFFIWFIQTYHPEAVEQFQALRDIERKIEQEEHEKAQRVHLEWQLKLAQQIKEAHEQRAKETQSIWGKMKQAVGIRRIEHGDYY